MKNNNNNKIHLLFDLNGTLMYRDRKRIQKKSLSHDLKLRKRHYIYLRPYVQELIEQLLTDERFCVYFYTSMEPQNFLPILELICSLSNTNLVSGILDRKFNKRDMEGEKKWDTMRDLNRVSEEYPTINNTNVIMIDNEFRKIREMSENALVIKDFTREIVGTDDTELKLLQQYFKEMSSVGIKDIRSYLKTNIFPPKKIQENENEKENEKGKENENEKENEKEKEKENKEKEKQNKNVIEKEEKQTKKVNTVDELQELTSKLSIKGKKKSN
ncbi:nuclear lim interactor-interacting factor-related [Anaeramoeba flamelloides]|uniref:Mitochondrial import inner membrane translocase subunit TIM50 n=1 Tax=Anaeramoeba flamelloides TaxID=1746091 RepID=A0AAV7YNM7_9EUKA|nr:nuclear lim interactor-interacting factor-related [Anaeramoeba flamelloides]